MKILGIVGSPRRDKGLTHETVSQVLAGAREAGAETQLLFLADGKPEYCIHCGHDCFKEGNCIQESAATERSQAIAAADGLVIGAPVYCWQPNALTACLFDKFRAPWQSWRTETTNNGRPALGIAVAGGSGTGVFPALQSIYSWLCIWRYRPLEPLPVTRFNRASALEQALAAGKHMAACPRKPYQGAWELMATYDSLVYLDYARTDEFRWLSEQIALGLEQRGDARDSLATIRDLRAEASASLQNGDREKAVQQYIESYGLGAQLW